MIKHSTGEVIKFIIKNKNNDITSIVESVNDIIAKLLEWHEIDTVGGAARNELYVSIKDILENCGKCKRTDLCKAPRGIWLKEFAGEIYVVHWFCPKQPIPDNLPETKFY